MTVLDAPTIINVGQVQGPDLCLEASSGYHLLGS
jgi:hypothetical protein